MMVNNFFWFTRMVAFGMWLLIEPCASAHRFSVGVTSLFSIVVIALGIMAMVHGDETFSIAILWIITGVVSVTLPAMFV